MQKDNVDSAIKLATNNMQNGILPLTDITLNLLKQKHPRSAPTAKEAILCDQPDWFIKLTHFSPVSHFYTP